MKAITTNLNQSISSKEWVMRGIQVFLGALYVTLLAQIEIPFKPIPMTMQTFAVYTLALFQGSKKSFCSLLLYLIAATIGMPVLSGMEVNPLWILGPKAGYLLSFPIAAFIIGKTMEMKNPPSFFLSFLGLCLGMGTVFALGVTFLSFFVGLEQALILGLYPFVMFDLVKLLGALSFKASALPVFRFIKSLMVRL